MQAAYPGGVGYPYTINVSFPGSQYTLGSAAETARTSLINTYGWTITDGGGIAVPFTFTVDTTLGDGLPEYEIRTNGAGYNYDITTSDGQSITGVTGNYNIIFPSAGQYTVEITGAFPHHWGFGAPDSLKLIDVSKWGSIAWSSMEYMFYLHSNLTVSATDAPNLSAVTNMSNMFRGSGVGNSDFTSWDTSNVTNMSGLFRDANSFNGNVSTWNTSNVNNMSSTFAARNFNGDISAWDVSSVTTFNECFLNAFIFNQDISGWNTSSATTFRYMFYNAYQFNADISGWNTSSLTSLDLTFRFAVMFDQNISGWNISGVTTFNNLFLNTVGPSQANYDAILIGWEAQAPQTGKSINFAEATFTPGGAAEAARTSLINTYGWTITDGGPRVAQTSGFLLDDYPGAAAAYSFRQLSSSTPVVAQLSTSNSSTDFRDFTATEMQRRLHQILGFRSLRTFYDQSGNGRHANDGNMLLESAPFGLVDGYPVARTNSGFGTMFTPQQALSVDNSSIFFVGKITAGGHLFNYSSSTAPVGGGRLLYADANLVNFSSASNDFSSNFTMNTTGLSLSYGVQNGQNVDLYHDLQTASGSMPSAVVTATNQYFGLTNVYPTTSGGPVNSAEFVFYPDDESANATGIRDNINEFYRLTTPYTDNLVASYNFDANFTDYTGTHNATLGAATVTAGSPGGVVSNCADFDGVNGYLNVPNSIDFSMTDGVSDVPYSISFWVKFDTTITDQWFINRWGGTSQKEWIIAINTSGQLTFLLSDGAGANYIRTDYTWAPTLSTWYHLVFTYDGSTLNTGLKMYINGSITPSIPSTVGPYAGTTQTLFNTIIGENISTTSSNFDGQMDELHLWKDRELTASEVTDIYNTENAGNSIFPPDYTADLVASYNFDSNFTDYTGNNPLTPSGTTPPVAGVAGGIVSNCAEFNSTGDYTLAADSNDFSFTDGVNDLPFSVSFWANFTSYDPGFSGGAWLLSKRDNSTNEEYQIMSYQNELAFVLFSGGGSANILNARIAYPPPIGSWHHYTFTYDGSATFAGLKIYIDGVSQSLTNNSSGTYTGMINGTQDVNIGSQSWQPSAASFEGKLDETHIWKNRELTASEVLDVYNTENAGNSILP